MSKLLSALCLLTLLAGPLQAAPKILHPGGGMIGKITIGLQLVQMDGSPIPPNYLIAAFHTR